MLTAQDVDTVLTGSLIKTRPARRMDIQQPGGQYQWIQGHQRFGFQLKLLKPFQSILGILSMQYCSLCRMKQVKIQYRFQASSCWYRAIPVCGMGRRAGLILKRMKTIFERDSSGKRLPYLDGIGFRFTTARQQNF